MILDFFEYSYIIVLQYKSLALVIAHNITETNLLLTEAVSSQLPNLALRL